MLLIMEKFVSEKGYRYLKLDGGTSIAARQPLINKFNEVCIYILQHFYSLVLLEDLVAVFEIEPLP